MCVCRFAMKTAYFGLVNVKTLNVENKHPIICVFLFIQFGERQREKVGCMSEKSQPKWYQVPPKTHETDDGGI